jgi:hypothetical protein
VTGSATFVSTNENPMPALACGLTGQLRADIDNTVPGQYS